MLANAWNTPSGGVFEQSLKSPAQREARECLVILNDGGMLPGIGGWHEAKLGAIVRNGVANDTRYVAVWGDQAEFHRAMSAALDAERWKSWQQLVWIADGARGNWTLAETVCPTALQVLDVMHAFENGARCGRLLLGEDSPLLPLWFATIKRRVEAGDVDALVGELMDCTLEATDVELEAINQLVGYYRHNQARMDYPRYRAMGIPIGSGIVESGHRHVLQCRMKRAGQHWSRHHGRRMVALRAAYRTAGPDGFHSAINRAYTMTHAKRHVAIVDTRAA